MVLLGLYVYWLCEYVVVALVVRNCCCALLLASQFNSIGGLLTTQTILPIFSLAYVGLFKNLIGKSRDVIGSLSPGIISEQWTIIIKHGNPPLLLVLLQLVLIHIYYQ